MKKIFNSIIVKRKDYCVVDLEKEYPDLVGSYRYVVVSEYSKEYLLSKYFDDICKYEPFEVADNKYLDFIKEEYSRERAEAYIQSSKMVSEAFDETYFEEHEIGICDFEKELAIRETLQEEYELVRIAFNSIKSPIIRRRLEKYFWEGKTQAEIATEENVNKSNVNASITRGLEKIEKFFLKKR